MSQLRRIVLLTMLVPCWMTTLQNSSVSSLCGAFLVVSHNVRIAPSADRSGLVLKSAATRHDETTRAISLSTLLLEGLRQHPTDEKTTTSSLNVETDFYDPTTGLHSEGVWHNCLVGIASLKLATLSQYSTKQDDNHVLSAIHIADSLYKYSWDKTSFQRRCYSGRWNHVFDQEEPHQANYYRASTEHRCIQHAIATVFWSRLVTYFATSKQEVFHQRYNDQFKILTQTLIQEYWNDAQAKWYTIGTSQGGGTLLRKSASWDKATMNVSKQDSNQTYYRAVDQAIALLACLEMLENKDVSTERERLVELVEKICAQLVSKDGFGYGLEGGSTRSYIGLQRNRNFWHDGWVVLALLSCAQQGHYFKDKQEIPNLLVNGLQRRYGDDDGLIWHWATSEKPSVDSGNVHYCGDNALWYAICQMSLPDKEKPKLELGTKPFWNFVTKLQESNNDKQHESLVSVADAYPQVRLHPNTELATLVSWSL